MDKPLTKWYCDVCGDAIETAGEAYVVWKSVEMRAQHFRIVHRTKCDKDKSFTASGPLEQFVGPRGLAYCLSFLSIGPVKKLIGQGSHCEAADLDEFVDFMRRVQTPFYEEARRLFKDRDFLDDWYDANEVLPYLPDELVKIIEKYSAHK